MTVLLEAVNRPAIRQRLRPIEDVAPGPPARWTSAPEPRKKPAPQPPAKATSLLASLHHHTANP